MFSSIESNAFDDYYEMFMGTKGTLILRREIEALFFEEGGGEAGATSITVAPQTAAAVALSSETQAGNTNQRNGAGISTVDATVRSAAIDTSADSTVLFGDSRRHAAGVRARQGDCSRPPPASAPTNRSKQKARLAV